MASYPTALLLLAVAAMLLLAPGHCAAQDETVDLSINTARV